MIAKKAGRPATGKISKPIGISIPLVLLDKLDRIKGDKSRSAWIAEQIKTHEPT